MFNILLELLSHSMQHPIIRCARKISETLILVRAGGWDLEAHCADNIAWWIWGSLVGGWGVCGGPGSGLRQDTLLPEIYLISVASSSPHHHHTAPFLLHPALMPVCLYLHHTLASPNTPLTSFWQRKRLSLSTSLSTSSCEAGHTVRQTSTREQQKHPNS